MNAIGMLFPGQGAQAVGMGRELCHAYASARDTFAEAGEATGLPLDDLCFSGPPEALSAGDVAQPAILTASVAALRALAEELGQMPPAAAAAGLSLGEYGALVAAGALSFREAVRLVRRRGLYMQEACEANPGAMYSIIGLADARVEQACEQVRQPSRAEVWPANYNSPGQVVISGREEAAAAAADLCTRMGARRAIRLKVAGAFHTPLMQPAADRLAPELHEVELREPQFPVVHNVTGRPAETTDEVRALLVAQLTSPVRWVACMQWMVGRGVKRYLELGPGRVLQGLLRRTDASCACRTINGPDDARAAATELKDVTTTHKEEP